MADVEVESVLGELGLISGGGATTPLHQTVVLLQGGDGELLLLK